MQGAIIASLPLIFKIKFMMEETKNCPVCGKKFGKAGLGLHIVNKAKSEAFLNALGEIIEPKHLQHLKDIGWKNRKVIFNWGKK